MNKPRGGRAVQEARHTSTDELDDFPTPPWATRALMQALDEELYNFEPKNWRAWEPACGRGHMSAALTESFGEVLSSDIHDYGLENWRMGEARGRKLDFLDDSHGRIHKATDAWIVTNPPFKLAPAFVHHALTCFNDLIGAAFLTRLSFLEGTRRHRQIFKETPPSFVFVFSERVPMLKGRCLRKATTATSYCWNVWLPQAPMLGPEIRWVPPGTRKRLERWGDYDDDVGEEPS